MYQIKQTLRPKKVWSNKSSFTPNNKNSINKTIEELDKELLIKTLGIRYE